MALPMFENRNGLRVVHWGNIVAFTVLVIILVAVLPVLITEYFFGIGKTTAVLSLLVATGSIAGTIGLGLTRPVERLPKSKNSEGA